MANTNNANTVHSTVTVTQASAVLSKGGLK